MCIRDREGIEAEIVHVGNKDIRGCIACRKCRQTGKCVFDDVVNEIAPKLKECDAFVIGSPVYFASPAGGAISFLDRLFFSTFNAVSYTHLYFTQAGRFDYGKSFLLNFQDQERMQGERRDRTSTASAALFAGFFI